MYQVTAAASLETQPIMTTSRNQFPTELYVEVGHGLTPAAACGTRRFTGNRAYLGIDKRDGNYDPIEGKHYGQRVGEFVTKLATELATKRPGENINFVAADACKLPLKDGVATEVYMANLLNLPINRWYKQDIADEAARVLQPGGRLVTKMSWDPEWLHPRLETAKVLEDAGLTVDEIAQASDLERFDELELLYGRSQHKLDDSYYVIASKA